MKHHLSECILTIIVINFISSRTGLTVSVNFDGNLGELSVMLIYSRGRFCSGISNLELQELALLG